MVGSAVYINLVLSLLMLLAGIPGAPQAQPPAATTHSPHGNLNITCQNCHTYSGWAPIRNIPEFDHNQTRYPLRGMHEGVACTQCHVKLVFTNVGHRCADCHADIHKRQLGSNCEQCHTVRGWRVSVQQIQQHNNRFPLVGAHAAVECDACHKNGALSQFSTMPTDCYSCHAKDYQGTTGPPHAPAGFSTTCNQCHSLDNWFGVKFDHLKYTGFALTGMHATLACNACHLNNQFKGTPANCVGCHLPDYQKTKNPNHVAFNFPQTCQTCHSTSAWQPATFDHSLVGFPLTGAHTTLQCAQCHANGNYNLNRKDCASCHLKDYDNTNNPNHKQAGIPTTCENCHNTTNWGNASFDHSATGFPLTGKHASTPCAQCHINGNYNIKDTSCVSCHLKDWNGTNNPNHTQAGFPQQCEMCHDTVQWADNIFNHANTGFPLTGAHAKLQCAQCHVNNNYHLTSGACSTCHMNDYNNTTDPNHKAAGFPTDCSLCHSTSSWGGAQFDHSKTGFPLTGAHTKLQCAQCHVNNNYHLTSGACSTCHMTDYNKTNNPNHSQAGFPTQCELCHDTITWTDSTFNHNNTGFPLTGAHTKLQCAQCHVNNNYHLTSAACSTCHMTDYNNTNNPNHKAAGFPTTCDLCHNTSSWAGAHFNHTWFPTNHGGAGGVCATCHTNPNNYTVFQCTNCHTKNQTDQQHQGVGGYQYNSQACYQCHPSGQGGG